MGLLGIRVSFNGFDKTYSIGRKNPDSYSYQNTYYLAFISCIFISCINPRTMKHPILCTISLNKTYINPYNITEGHRQVSEILTFFKDFLVEITKEYLTSKPFNNNYPF